MTGDILSPFLLSQNPKRKIELAFLLCRSLIYISRIVWHWLSNLKSLECFCAPLLLLDLELQWLWNCNDCGKGCVKKLSFAFILNWVASGFTFGLAQVWENEMYWLYIRTIFGFCFLDCDAENDYEACDCSLLVSPFMICGQLGNPTCVLLIHFWRDLGIDIPCLNILCEVKFVYSFI